jgi:hypothetical protein
MLKRWLMLIILSLLLLRPAYAQLAAGDEFTFVRIQWTDSKIRYGYGFSTDAPLWAHDYPDAENHLYVAIELATNMNVAKTTKVMRFSDEEIFQYPVIYACEIGYLSLSENEVANLREYLLRGGLLIVDDFRLGFEYRSWMHEIRRVLPHQRLEKIDVDHPIFHCFFDLSEEIYTPIPYLKEYNRKPQYLGLFDDSDRLMVLMNFDTDIGDGWELPGQEGIEEFSTTSFKLGINYLIYAYTH